MLILCKLSKGFLLVSFLELFDFVVLTIFLQKFNTSARASLDSNILIMSSGRLYPLLNGDFIIQLPGNILQANTTCHCLVTQITSLFAVLWLAYASSQSSPSITSSPPIPASAPQMSLPSVSTIRRPHGRPRCQSKPYTVPRG